MTVAGLGWTLRRLSAMGPAEVVHRARIDVRDRMGPPWYGGPARTAADRLFVGDAPDRLAALVHAPARGAPGFEPVLAAAHDLGRGRWCMFGRPVQLGDPPVWNANPLTGTEWPNRTARAIDSHHLPSADPLEDPKYVWEPGRLTMLPLLALETRLTGDPGAAVQAAHWAMAFAEQAPLGLGIHHTSGIEMAVRAMTLTWTLALIPPEFHDRIETRTIAAFIAQQALWCRDHLSLGSSANNHLLAEYAGMAVAAAAFPALRGADRLLDQALLGLAREVPRQIHPDGVPAEQAFAYLPFVWELLLCAFLAGEAAGRATPGEVRARLAASLEFARVIRLPHGGFPHVGDEDDGRMLLAVEGWSRLDLVGNALAAWLGAPALSWDDALARVLLGGTSPPAAAPPGEHVFEHGGYTVWHAGDVRVTFDHGPLGLGALAAHGHADALAVTLQVGDTPVIVDPGTFAYHGDRALRDRCRATPSHSTVHFGGRSQAEMLGPFLWGRRWRMAREPGGWRCHWPSGEQHRRAIEVDAHGMVVRDRVEGGSPTLVFALPAGADVRLDGVAADVITAGIGVRFEASGTGAWRIEPGLVAERFATPIAAPRLVADVARGEATTHIRLARS